jgi:hypothetical protein
VNAKAAAKLTTGAFAEFVSDKSSEGRLPFNASDLKLTTAAGAKSYQHGAVTLRGELRPGARWRQYAPLGR